MLAEGTPSQSRTRGLDNSPGFDNCLAMVSCTAEPYPCPGGAIVLLRVAGEIDQLTHPVLHAALDVGLDGTARHLVIDLAGVTFCCVRGFALLADTAAAAATAGIGYAISGLPGHLERYARMLWTGRAPIRCYPSAAVAVTTIRVEQATTTPPDARPT